ncbi:MAG: hypothetical protein ABJC89_03980 [Acidobacteriota bacterium]
MVLIAAPWFPFWDRNFFARHLPMLEGFFANLFVRGAVSGIGAITVLAGLAELAGMFAPRFAGRQARVANREP